MFELTPEIINNKLILLDLQNVLAYVNRVGKEGGYEAGGQYQLIRNNSSQDRFSN